ncbi:MAG: DinB family protein [Anaerolineales bacterium]|jgi:hypothetical protein
MNTLDILKYGHRTLLKSIQDLPEADWETGGVCGVWSVKEILIHLTSYEYFLQEALDQFIDQGATPIMQAMQRQGADFNDIYVGQRKNLSVSEVKQEYREAQAKSMEMAAKIPEATYRRNGEIPWYGEQYCLEDFIVYTQYGHKREHSAQIMVFRDTLK